MILFLKETTYLAFSHHKNDLYIFYFTLNKVIVSILVLDVEIRKQENHLLKMTHKENQ